MESDRGETLRVSLMSIASCFANGGIDEHMAEIQGKTFGRAMNRVRMRTPTRSPWVKTMLPVPMIQRNPSSGRNLQNRLFYFSQNMALTAKHSKMFGKAVSPPRRRKRIPNVRYPCFLLGFGVHPSGGVLQFNILLSHLLQIPTA